ncbi:LysR family transcriptional regulator [Sphingomonas nostoxanthinifaciens]|uniref:LysR family transcriptional regulator n=1 Tax=Sphingomonas nostoxanthinifaciens TaxID=2872652 RepID=UPI001CC21A32|nr:LysR family transcriptional regulator [Sphingomonas nostoxanthinifaciens]UAK23551.1 LysR family transcriptional regulator [Sphingomonas nostoxanthinifaciens]
MRDPFDLNLRHFLALRTIAERGRLGAAAEAESMTQPALTQGLARLEAQLGQPLFARRADGMRATDAGALAVDRATRALWHLRALPAARGFASPERLVTSAQLRAFRAVADAGSYHAAARAVGLSQAAIHRGVRDLEQILAVPLVERRGRGIMLTERGRSLARIARLVAAEMAAAITETAHEQPERVALAVGAMPLSRAQLLPRAIERLLATIADAHVAVIEGSWRELVEPLRDGTIDLMVGALRDGPAVADLAQTPLFEDRLVIVAGAHHALAGAALPPLEDLARHRWIVGPAGAPLRQHWEQLFAGRPLPPAPIECGSVMTIRELLRGGDYLTLLSPAQVAVEVAAGILAHVGGPLAACVRTIGVTTRAHWRPVPAQAALLGALSEVATRLD